MTRGDILLVDDDPDLLKLISLRLTSAGYQVRTADSGETALATIAVERPATVITDLRMPGIDGLQLFDAIHRQHPALPVIVLTAHGTIPDAVSATQRAFADALLRATGKVEWVDDEALMDAVTAVSGSGPAYVFLIAEELARAGVAAGLPEDLAVKIARETVSGAGDLLKQSDLDAATLPKNVTSPGGTTAAALDVLMGKDGMQQLMTRAGAAATKRSKELAG